MVNYGRVKKGSPCHPDRTRPLFCHPERARAQPARVKGSLKTKTVLVIPSVSRGILYRTQKLFRTRLYAWLPPEGPGARKQGSQKVSKNFLGRGAAGAAGKTASTARRLPWRLAGDEMRGYCPCNRQRRRNKDRSTLIRHAQQAARATFPLKKGEGMIGKACVF